MANQSPSGGNVIKSMTQVKPRVSGQEMEDTVEAQVLRRGRVAMAVDVDSGGRGAGGLTGRGLDVSKKGQVDGSVES